MNTEENNQPVQEQSKNQEIVTDIPEIPSAPKLDIEQHLSIADLPSKS